VTLDDWRLLGQRVIDVSPYGLLVGVRSAAPVGQEIFVSFQVPGGRGWFDAQAEVVRVVRGRRQGDPGAALGLRFTEVFDVDDWMVLADRFERLPRPEPVRSPWRRFIEVAHAA
jgi:hypothetical protein